MTKAEFEAAKARAGSPSPFNEWRNMIDMLERAMEEIDDIPLADRSDETWRLLAEWNAETGGEEEQK